MLISIGTQLLFLIFGKFSGRKFYLLKSKNTIQKKNVEVHGSNIILSDYIYLCPLYYNVIAYFITIGAQGSKVPKRGESHDSETYPSAISRR